MAEANSLTALLMELNEDFEIENVFFDDDEEDISISPCFYIYTKKFKLTIEGFYEETVPRYLPSEFSSHFRMTRSTMEIIWREIVNTGKISPQNARGGQPFPPEKQILLSLWCMANQECKGMLLTVSMYQQSASQRKSDVVGHLSHVY